jgi:hypothetical protein
LASDKFFSLLKKFDALHSLALNRPGLTGSVRATSYVAYRGLELVLGKRHPHERVLAQARQLQLDSAIEKPGATAATNVLFVTLRGWFVHSAVQALIAKSLELRGARTRFVVCDGGFSQCDFKPASDFHTTRPLCWRCQSFTRKLLDALHLPRETLEGLGIQQVREKARTLILSVDGARLHEFEYEGMPLYEWCYASIRRTLLRGDAGEGRLSEAVVRGYLESAIVYVEASRRLIERHRPDVCVLINGLFHAERVFSEVARAAGVRVVSYEVGFRPRSFHFTDSGAAAHFPVDELWQQQRDTPLDAAEEARLDRYFSERSRGGGVVSIYWPRMDSRREHLAARLGLRPDRPMAVLFPNIAWDSATVRLDTAFRSMKHWVEETIGLFARHPDKQLVIRIHPAEIRLPMMETRDPIGEHLRNRFPALPPNVRLVAAEDPADSYELLAMSDAVIVYTSTLGLEAAAQGRRVIVAARPHYARRGFTEDVSDAAGYEDVVFDAMSRPELNTEQRTLARRYANMLLYRYMVDFPWVIDSPRRSRGLDIERLSELEPGRDPKLDDLCNLILDRPSC